MLLHFPGVCLALSFLAFMGHLPCCGWSLMDCFAPSVLTISPFATTLNSYEQRMLPFSLWLPSLPMCKAFACLFNGSEDYGKEFSEPQWCHGFHSLNQLICGEMRFSSHPIYGGDYIPTLMLLFEDKFQEKRDVP